MQVGFPPTPVYPLAIDTDRTLYLVYNTAATQTTANNQAWSDEIPIQPVASDASEIWANNGFANINGELFYYDNVEKNIDGKVQKLLRCARNLGGKKTTYNPVGSWVRGFVVAEHHNQIVDAVLKVEDFVGIDFSENRYTLDWRIRNLAALGDCIDDHDCPAVDFGYTVETDGTCEGTVINYTTLLIGSYNNFRIDFGDGNFSTELNGTHTYAPGATVDPIVTVSNDKCEIVQSPNTRNNPEEPKRQTTQVGFDIPLPTIPPFPTISIPSFVPPSTEITLPPIVFPCISTGTIGGTISIPSSITIDMSNTIPSVISIVTLSIPSLVISFEPLSFTGDDISITFNPISITFGSLTLPSVISFSDLSVTVSVAIPSLISVVADIPTLITVVDNIPSRISFGPLNIPSVISFGPVSFPMLSIAPISMPAFSITPVSLPPITFDTPPTVQVDWSSPPPITGTVTVTCGGAMAADSARFAEMDNVQRDDFQDAFKQAITVDAVEWAIPSEIKVIAPKIPDIKVSHDIPNTIEVISPEIPDKIEIIGPKQPIPSKIEIIADSLPTEIKVVAEGLPDIIELDGSRIPESIKIEVPEFPVISIDASGLPKTIEVTGIPESIEIKGQIPSEIFIKAPENLEVPLVYKGGPIPIQLDMKSLSNGSDEETPCFALVPCPKK